MLELIRFGMLISSACVHMYLTRIMYDTGIRWTPCSRSFPRTLQTIRTSLAASAGFSRHFYNADLFLYLLRSIISRHTVNENTIDCFCQQFLLMGMQSTSTLWPLSESVRRLEAMFFLGGGLMRCRIGSGQRYAPRGVSKFSECAKQPFPARLLGPRMPSFMCALRAARAGA